MAAIDPASLALICTIIIIAIYMLAVEDFRAVKKAAEKLMGGAPASWTLENSGPQYSSELPADYAAMSIPGMNSIGRPGTIIPAESLPYTALMSRTPPASYGPFTHIILQYAPCCLSPEGYFNHQLGGIFEQLAREYENRPEFAFKVEKITKSNPGDHFPRIIRRGASGVVSEYRNLPNYGSIRDWIEMSV